MSAHPWSDAANLLCIRLDSLGDVLMTTPALRALKESRPGRRLTLMTSPSGAAAATYIPEVDSVITYDAPWMNSTSRPADLSADEAMIKTLRHGDFDAAVIFTVFSQSALPAATYCHLAGIRRSLAHCRENPYFLLSDWVRETEPENGIRHEVRRQLDLVASIGCRTRNQDLSLTVPDDDRVAVQAMLSDRGIDRKSPWLAVHPGATAPSRRYPPERFAEVVRALRSCHGFQIVLTGGDHERELADSITRAAGVQTISMAGRLSLGELAALIERAPVLISNNSGPAHIAAAVGTPVVDLYALTNPQHTPWRVPCRVLYHDVPCKNCFRSVCPEVHHACLARVEPAAVVSATLELLGDSERGFDSVSHPSFDSSLDCTNVYSRH